jgi:hypothetical protein
VDEAHIKKWMNIYFPAIEPLCYSDLEAKFSNDIITILKELQSPLEANQRSNEVLITIVKYLVASLPKQMNPSIPSMYYDLEGLIKIDRSLRPQVESDTAIKFSSNGINYNDSLPSNITCQEVIAVFALLKINGYIVENYEGKKTRGEAEGDVCTLLSKVMNTIAKRDSNITVCSTQMELMKSQEMLANRGIRTKSIQDVRDKIEEYLESNSQMIKSSCFNTNRELNGTKLAKLIFWEVLTDSERLVAYKNAYSKVIKEYKKEHPDVDKVVDNKLKAFIHLNYPSNKFNPYKVLSKDGHIFFK